MQEKDWWKEQLRNAASEIRGNLQMQLILGRH